MRTFFFCYDREMNRKLREEGFRYITVALHPRNHRIFWMYEQTVALSEALLRLSREGGET